MHRTCVGNAPLALENYEWKPSCTEWLKPNQSLTLW